MRIKFYRCIIVLLISFLTACTAPVGVSPASATPAKTEPTAPVAIVFADPLLERMVRQEMGKTEGDITTADAESVTELELGIDSQPQIPPETQIKDLSGLEYFINLETLDLSFHAITDISPLAGLNRLTWLSLDGNPIAEISPLSGLTSLQVLILSNCQAVDYTPLSKLTSLDFLILDNSTITDLNVLSNLSHIALLSLIHTQVSDVSPLSALTNLLFLYLEGCPVSDYAPLADLYTNLREKDFIVVSFLTELGFSMDEGAHMAHYYSDGVHFFINHSEWGAPLQTQLLEANSVHMYHDLENGYQLIVGYYPASQTYVFGMSGINDIPMNYFYDPSNGAFTFKFGDRESAEQVIRTALGDSDAEDVLLAPISVFEQTIKNTFHMSANALYALPFGQLTLKNLGFVSDEENAVCLYEQREGIIMNLEVHRPEWGEKEYDFRFYTPINDYGLVITYHMNEQRFQVSSDLGETYAVFYYFLKDGSTVDGVVSGAATVKEYFQNMYNDPEITDIYSYSVRLVEQYISDTFGLSIDELCTLPVGK